MGEQARLIANLERWVDYGTWGPRPPKRSAIPRLRMGHGTQADTGPNGAVTCGPVAPNGAVGVVQGAPMICAGVAVVKNESDIIEAFVRQNLQHLDWIDVVDNDSTDGTWQILQALETEGLRLRLDRVSNSYHPQRTALSEYLESQATVPDWLFLLDADEFIRLPAGRNLAEVLGGLDT